MGTEDWYSAAVDKGRPTAEALAALITALMLHGDPDDRLETAEEWIEVTKQLLVEPTPAVYAALAAADVVSGDFEQVEARMQQMEMDGLEMNADSLTALLLSYANSDPQQRQIAEQVFKQQMLRGRVKPTRDVLEALRAACGGARCLDLRRQLDISRIEP